MRAAREIWLSADVSERYDTRLPPSEATIDQARPASVHRVHLNGTAADGDVRDDLPICDQARYGQTPCQGLGGAATEVVGGFALHGARTDATASSSAAGAQKRTAGWSPSR